MSFTALDAALTGAGVPSDQLPVWRMLYVLEDKSRMAPNGVYAENPLNPAQFVARMQSRGILE